MNLRTSRRAFLGAVPLAIGTAGLTGDLVLGADAHHLTTGSGRDLDSLIDLILDTPRERRVEVIANELRRGLLRRTNRPLSNCTKKFGLPVRMQP